MNVGSKGGMRRCGLRVVVWKGASCVVVWCCWCCVWLVAFVIYVMGTVIIVPLPLNGPIIMGKSLRGFGLAWKRLDLGEDVLRTTP